jgi:twitching motility protein PilT
MQATAHGLFGQICVESGYVTQEQIAECVRIQAQLGNRQHHLGALLVHRGYLTEGQLEEIVRRQQGYRAQPHAAVPGSPESSWTPLEAAPSRQPGAAGAPGIGARPLAAGSRLAVLLDGAERRRASDLHLHPGTPLALRAGGRLLVSNQAPLEGRDLEAILTEALTEEQRASLERDLAVEAVLVTAAGLRCRAAFYRAHTGLHGAFRLLRRTPPTLEELGLPTQIASLTGHSQGMVLVAGLAGSGKTCTLAALVDLIASERGEHVLSLEEPIEIVHPPKRALVNQRQLGRDSASAARALRAALREDPDVIAIGDLRDRESISLAVTAAETGHLVIAGMNTASAARAVSRIIGAFPPSQHAQIRAMVSESLKGVVAQRLLPAVDGGLAAAVEFLVVTPAVSNLIREDKLFQIRSQMQTGKAMGMRTLDESLRELVASGRVATEDARRIAENPASIPGAPPAPAAPAPGVASGAPAGLHPSPAPLARQRANPARETR